MASLVSTAGLARASARRPWFVVGAWIATLVAAIVIQGVLGDSTTTEFNFSNNPEAVRGLNLIEDSGLRGGDPVRETVIVRAEGTTVDDPAFQQRVEQTAAALRARTDLIIPESVVSYYEARAAGAPEAEGLVSADRRTTLIPVSLTGTIDEANERAGEYLSLVDEQTGNGFEVLTVGLVSISEESNVIAEEDLIRGESIGIAAALVILVVVFGALVAAGLPLLLAIASIAISFGLTAILGRVWELSFFITNMITMIGLAVGVDYALFVVERYREERRHGLAKRDAIAVAGGTASRAVLFSGSTVVLALLGMFLLPVTIFRSLAAGAILVVVVAVFATLTLIPALLSLLGDKIDWPRRRTYDAAVVAAQERYDHETIHAGFWGRITRVVMARPIIAAALAAGLLIAAAIPYLDINTGFAYIETYPDSDVKTGFNILNEEFSAGRLSPVEVAIEGARNDPETTAAIDRLRQALAADTYTVNGEPRPTFDFVGEPVWNPGSEEHPADTVALVTATLGMDGNADPAYQAIERVRDEIVPAAFGGAADDVLVTGDTAFNQDFFSIVDEYTPIVFAFVLGLSFLLLLLVFRSIVVAVKAIILNLLSVGAAYGLLVLVFQKGFLIDVFGFQEAPTIEAWLPIFLFCVLFGLSMDYHVFLLSRIKEHFDATGRNAESVAVGLQSTARIITGAALIMVAVFGGFASGRLIFLQQMGFGLAVAVLIDATIVRSILVPSLMALLGDRNWYLPRWLHWLPNLGVEGRPAPTPQPQPSLESAAD